MRRQEKLAGWQGRRRAIRAAALLVVLVPPCGGHTVRAEDAVVDPYLGDPAAIEDGDSTYKAKCIICHGKGGGRGPNLFATRLNDAQFLATVTNGRKGTLMPSFGLRLTADDIWKVRAFLKAHPNGL